MGGVAYTNWGDARVLPQNVLCVCSSKHNTRKSIGGNLCGTYADVTNQSFGLLNNITLIPTECSHEANFVHASESID